jgi:threonine/homoserine/homoserine lactone efflux protein
VKEFPAFIAFIVGWSLLANAAGHMHVNPIAVFAGWLVGFVWGCAYIMAGKLAADHLTKRWLQLMIGVVLVGGLVGLALS